MSRDIGNADSLVILKGLPDSSKVDLNFNVVKGQSRGPIQGISCRGPNAPQSADILVAKFESESTDIGMGDLQDGTADADKRRLRIFGHRSFGARLLAFELEVSAVVKHLRAVTVAVVMPYPNVEVSGRFS